MLFRTTASTTGSCAAMSGRSSAISPPEKKPSWPPRRSRSSARPNLSFTSLTEERSARVLRRDGWRNSSQDDPTGLPDIPSRLDAVGMLAGPRQQLRQRHDPRLARDLPAVMHEHQRRDALDGANSAAACSNIGPIG